MFLCFLLGRVRLAWDSGTELRCTDKIAEKQTNGTEITDVCSSFDSRFKVSFTTIDINYCKVLRVLEEYKGNTKN